MWKPHTKQYFEIKLQYSFKDVCFWKALKADDLFIICWSVTCPKFKRKMWICERRLCSISVGVVFDIFNAIVSQNQESNESMLCDWEGWYYSLSVNQSFSWTVIQHEIQFGTLCVSNETCASLYPQVDSCCLIEQRQVWKLTKTKTERILIF